MRALILTFALVPALLTAKTAYIKVKGYGTIKIKLYEKEAPLTVKNFIRYANSGFYNGTIFHRVKEFLIQGGGYKEDMSETKKMSPIKNEASPKRKNKKGTIAMARKMHADSATNQFYINVKSNPEFDKKSNNAGFAVFGKVTGGIKYVRKIAKVKTHFVRPNDDVPVKPIIIESVKVE